MLPENLENLKSQLTGRSRLSTHEKNLLGELSDLDKLSSFANIKKQSKTFNSMGEIFGPAPEKCPVCGRKI